MPIGSTLALGLALMVDRPAFSCLAPTAAVGQGPATYCLAFDPDQVSLGPTVRGQLDAIIIAHRSGRRIDLILVGRVEPSRSGASCCVGLSQRRQHLVRGYLTDHGVAPGDIIVSAFGDEDDAARKGIRILFGPGAGW